MTRLRTILAGPTGVAIVCAFGLFTLYLRTTAPDITWTHSNEDSGDLIAAAWVRGIPHPTGYPWYLLTCKLVMDLVPLGTIAWRAHLYSIINGVLACVLAGLALRQLAPAFLPGLPPERTRPWLQATSTLLAGVSFPVWSQSIIAEVYAASLAFVAAMLLVVSLWLSQPEDPARDRYLPRFALLQGFALTNHLTSIYAGIAGMVVLLWSRHWPRPDTWRRIPIALLAPLSLYGVLMFFSAQQPPLDWTDTEHPDNLITHATGRQFRFMLLGSHAVQVINRLIIEMDFTTDAGPWLAILALGGMVWGLTGARPAGRAFTLGLLTIWGFNIWHICNYAVEDFEAFLLPAALMLQLLATLGIAGLATLARATGPAQLMPSLWAWTLVTVLVNGAGNYPRTAIPVPTDPVLMREDARQQLPPGALLVERFYGRGFAWWYFRETDPYWRDHDIDIVYVESLRAPWGRELLKRTNPSVVLESPLTPDESKVIEHLIAENIDRRPVYTGFIPWQDPEHFGWRPAGMLYRVYRQPQPGVLPAGPPVQEALVPGTIIPPE